MPAPAPIPRRTRPLSGHAASSRVAPPEGRLRRFPSSPPVPRLPANQSVSETHKDLCVSGMNFNRFRDRFHRFACFSGAQVLAAFPGFARGNYREWIAHGYLVRLRRDWYAFADTAEIPGICDHVASRIYSPSYLSCETVLSRCGLIPESVVQLVSCTPLKTARFENPFGQFAYRTLKPSLMFGYVPVPLPGGLHAFAATPSKALCDFLHLNPHLSSPDDLEALRLDPELLADLFDSGELPRTAARFASPALSRRLDLLRKVCLP